MLTRWCGALPGVTMAVLYLAHIHAEHACAHNQCVVVCRVSTTADVMLLFAAWCHHCSCIESSSSSQKTEHLSLPHRLPRDEAH